MKLENRISCFVIMPFHADFDVVFLSVQDAVCSSVVGDKIACHWLKDVHAAGRISDDIVNLLHGAALAIADITGCNPNVMWETGYAMALGKPTILIGQNIGNLPFDLKMHRVIEYRLDNLPQFAHRLREAVRQTLDRYKVSPDLPRQPGIAHKQTIAVTGSFEADAERTSLRVMDILSPYVGHGYEWLCGGSGFVNAVLLEF
jgi:hypothetical protein